MTALMLASVENHADVVRTLLTHSASVHTTDQVCYSLACFITIMLLFCASCIVLEHVWHCDYHCCYWIINFVSVLVDHPMQGGMSWDQNSYCIIKKNFISVLVDHPPGRNAIWTTFILCCLRNLHDTVELLCIHMCLPLHFCLHSLGILHSILLLAVETMR